jgi:hypothetical protein
MNLLKKKTPQTQPEAKAKRKGKFSRRFLKLKASSILSYMFSSTAIVPALNAGKTNEIPKAMPEIKFFKCVIPATPFPFQFTVKADTSP